MLRSSLCLIVVLSFWNAAGAQDESEIVTALLKSCQDEEASVRFNALAVLASIAPQSNDVIDACLRGLQDENDTVRSAALRSLVRTNADTEVKVRALVGAINETGFKAAFVQGELARIGEPAVPQLVEAMKVKETRLSALSTLYHFGNKARAAIPAVLEALEDEDPKVRRQAVYCLGQIAGKSTPETSAPRSP